MHSLKVSKDNDFEPREELNESGKDSLKWNIEKNNFESITHRVVTSNKKKMRFRRDPSKNFKKTVTRVAGMLIQDLVVIFDEILNDLMLDKSLPIQNFPQGKIEALKKYVDPEFEWSIKGSMELIAVRNAITHSKSFWNDKSLRILKDYDVISQIEFNALLGQKVIVTFPMVFEYKKSMRTFINQVNTGTIE
ncbi:hypothetical protein N7U66_04795 [Lacinutrix neustonica]|uniref:Uncharacterized protein n=1 Tax=Lacinutrix neustonica TaxID=2980107 RepID=A0A9E8MXY5_9FLAO|nr:hypothetical protein [Lacinutrix neustonica]WAC02950.1 hypothetical protein N7U66_04795 [Lacinutrix neustonica]